MASAVRSAFCPVCGTETEVFEGDSVCLHCGTDIGAREVEAEENKAGDGSETAIHFGAALASLLEHILGESPSIPPADDDFVRSLATFALNRDSPHARRVILSVASIRCECVAAQFGPSVGGAGGAGKVEARLVAAAPAHADEPLVNDPVYVAEAALLVDRGRCSFARKALRCQERGAAAVVVVQRGTMWPYVMTDSVGEAAREGLRIPVVMVSHADGARLKAHLDQAADGPTLVLAEEPRDLTCPICRCSMEGEQVIRLQCTHLFHSSCLTEWLKRSAQCPMCRLKLDRPDERSEARQEEERERMGRMYL